MRVLTIISALLLVAFCVPAQDITKQILLVNIEDKSRAGIGEMINVVESHKPKLVAFDMTFEDQMEPVGDQKLSDALFNCENIVMASRIVEIGDVSFASISNAMFAPLNAQDGFINTFAEPVSGVPKLLDEFVVRRKTSLSPTPIPHFAVAIASMVDSATTQKFIQSNPDRVPVDYAGGKRRFRVTSYNQLISGKVGAAEIRDKIVIFGFMGPGEEDLFITGWKRRKCIYGVEIIANIVVQILER